MFLFKVQKSFEDKRKTSDGIDILMHNIEKFVIENKGQDITRTRNQITFKVSMLGWTWDYFSLLDAGIFIVEENKVIFKFSLYKRILVFIIMSSLIVYTSKNIFACFPFIIMLLLNWATALVRYRGMLNKLG